MMWWRIGSDEWRGRRRKRKREEWDASSIPSRLELKHDRWGGLDATKRKFD